MDEFDRVEDDDALSLMSDTIKSLSDHNIATKVVIVGVADSLEELVGEHASVQRAIEEVPMPRMTEDEASNHRQWPYRGRHDDRPDRAPAHRPSAEGLPHYVHLLALHAARNAVLRDRTTVEVEDVEVAVDKATQKYAPLSEYQRAIDSAYPGNLFSRVLAVCARRQEPSGGTSRPVPS